MCTFMHVACACVHILVPNWFWCFLDPSFNIIPSFIKIWLHLLEIWGFVFCSKLHARFHVLCAHARTCVRTNTFNQLRRPIFKYADDFVEIWRHLAEIVRCVTSVTKTSQTDRQTDTAQIYIRCNTMIWSAKDTCTLWSYQWAFGPFDRRISIKVFLWP